MNKGYLYAQIASTLITTAGIYKGFELYSFAAGSITNTAIVSASSLIFVLKIRKTEEISFLGFNWEVFKDTYKSTLQHVWGLIGEVLGTLNVMFVTLFVSADAAVIYSLNRKVLDIPIHISNLLVLSLSASYAHGLGSGTQFPAQKIALELSHFNAAIASSISLFYVVILPTLIKFWIGEEYFAGSLFMFLSAVSAFTSCQMSISYALNHASGEYAHANLLMLIGNIARILLIPLLVASYGINMMPLIQILISACFVIRLWKLFWKTIQKQGFGLEPLPELNNKILFLHGSTLMLCILLSVWKLQGNILWVSLLGGTLFVVNMAAHIAVDPFLSRQRQLIIQSLLLVRQIGKRFLSKKVAHFESQETV
jgi:O-antigen/teichoic acid export membrane protein